MSDRWQLERGATLREDGSVHFSVWAPNAERVTVEIVSGPATGGGEHALRRNAQGVHEGTVADVGANADYFYHLDGGAGLPDPVSRWQAQGVHGPSRVVDPQFAWRDRDWHGIGMSDLVIYELHVGTYTDERTFEGILPHLPGLKALGVTAIELMPVAQFPGTRNWGYDGASMYAVQDSYGGPNGLKQLVDTAHLHGLAVILDVVYNHVGPEGSYLAAYGPYFTQTYTTPWGPALNYDDAMSDEVRRYVVDNALYWTTEYHVDALRLDAVHRIYDCSAVHLLDEVAQAVHAEGPKHDRQILVIAESDLNDPKLVRERSSYGFGLDGQWADDFHHALHVLLTGEKSGYYADFGGVEAVARALEEPFVYRGQYSVHRRRRHGGPSTGIPRERFVVAVQNHDQIGNRAAGERLSTLVNPAQLRLAAALLLLSPYVPLLFMGEEYAETKPFLYFVSHGDPALVEAVRTGRRKEFESFGWTDAVPDPQDEETFARSTLDRSVLVSGGFHMQMLDLHRDLLALRRDEPMLHPDGSSVVVEWTRDGSIALLRYARAWRMGRTGAMLALFNCAGESREVSVPEDANGAWSLRLSTDATSYGGSGAVIADIADDEAARLSRKDEPKRLLDAEGTPVGRGVRLPAWTAVVFERRDF